MVSRLVSRTARPGGHREPARAARWLLMGALLMPAGPVRGQTGLHPASEARAGEVPTARHSEWTAIGLGGGGAMYMPAVSPADPRLMLLGCDMSGSYRSIDGGKTWEMIHHRHLSGTTSLRPIWHPTDPDVAFAARGTWQANLLFRHPRGGEELADVASVGQPAFCPRLAVMFRSPAEPTSRGASVWAAAPSACLAGDRPSI